MSNHLGISDERYARLEEFSRELQDGTSDIGQMISIESIRRGGEIIERAYEDHLVAVGAAVKLKPYELTN